MAGGGTSSVTGTPGLSGGIGGAAPGLTGGPATGGAPAPAGSAPAAANANPLLGGLQPGGSDTNTDTLRIIPDAAEQRGAGLRHRPARTTRSRRCCARSTSCRLQVRIDAVIAEVTLNDNLQYGTQFFFKAGGINGILATPRSQTRQPTPRRPA